MQDTGSGWLLVAGGSAVRSANLVDRTSYPRINTLPFGLFSRINTLPLGCFSRINTLPTSALSHTGRGFAGILPVCITCIYIPVVAIAYLWIAAKAPTHNRLGPPPNTNKQTNPRTLPSKGQPFKAICESASHCSGRWQR